MNINNCFNCSKSLLDSEWNEQFPFWCNQECYEQYMKKVEPKEGKEEVQPDKTIEPVSPLVELKSQEGLLPCGIHKYNCKAHQKCLKKSNE